MEGAMNSEPKPTPQFNSQLGIGVISVILMLGGAYLAFTGDIAIGAALITIGAAVTPSVAWWRRSQRDDNLPE
jgi:hypothetical protein